MNKALVRRKKPPSKQALNLPWVLDDKKRDQWALSLANGLIEVCVWNGRIDSILWRWFDGFRCQIRGEETFDLEFPNATVEEAKDLAINHVAVLTHQLGAEIGLWPKKVEVVRSDESVLFRSQPKS